ncbi:hypothetical protein C8A03DRAFT_29296 [Achaetomium macrosporum]|uniref:C2H2-type domain-containing protein n=1 Tax=Achaetomium macrosporum TaxID=79813 RepID=A0AAN7CI85_9PEZI|nr:hypothetical protein C8A03DRAFT_29296 [Achaetomium macrosporum]
MPRTETVVYEARNIIYDASYPSMDHHHPEDAVPNSHADRHADPSDAVVHVLANASTAAPNRESSTAKRARRGKATAKPAREAVRNADGKYDCTWPDCSDAKKVFDTERAWNNHMDKHERPYKCRETGCENLSGFTYSGGLTRHLWEVHGIHDGQKREFYCPHESCKRSGEAFTRRENLNEHMRRVHTQNVAPLTPAASQTEDSDDTAATGRKRRKRPADSDLHEELKRVRQENDALRQEVQAQTLRNDQLTARLQKVEEMAQQFRAAALQTAQLAPEVTAAPFGL